MARRNDVHVSKVSGGSRWKVTQQGQEISRHNTQGAAIGRGVREAKQDRVDLVTHSHDGRIRSKDSYGNDPLPPRDRER
jgi:hypothetical protein